MRIWYQSMTELDRVPDYARVLGDHIATSSPDGVAVELVGLPPGTYGGRPPMEVLAYPLGFHRALTPVLDNVECAARDGYDAFLMGSFVAPMLREARSAVDIPIASMAESVILTAHSLSRRIGLVCISDAQVATATDLLESVGLMGRIAAVRSIDTPATEDVVAQALGTTTGAGGELEESFVRACTSVVSAGADLVVPAEGILSEVVRTRRIRSVGGAPVLDCVEVSIAHVVMLARLFRSGAVGMGRLVSYPKLP